MQIREAKDFLVQRTAEQAQMEGVALSELEKRMMYFTETGEMQEDFIQLNEDFEAEYDPDEYEAKIHGLMHRAYARVKKENPEMARRWKEAIRELGKGDHYLSVLWGEGLLGASYPKERPRHDFLKLLGTALLLAIVAISLGLIADHYGIHWGGGRRGDPPRIQTQGQMPVWLQRLLILVFVGGYIYFAVLPFVMKKSPPGLQRVVDKIVRVWSKKVPGDR